MAIFTDEPLYTDDGFPRWIEHPAYGSSIDVVALPLQQIEGADLYPYDIVNTGPDISIRVADTVSVIGYPFGLTAGNTTAVWATGFIATEPQLEFDDQPQFLIDCRSRQGQSGSPVIAFRSGGGVPMEDGGMAVFSGHIAKLLGVYSGRISAESDLGRVWKISLVREILAFGQPATQS